MSAPDLTRGQLERMLSQRIQALYRDQLGHQPEKISCELFDDKLAIIVEGSITQPEQLLLEEGKDSFAEEIRESLDDAVRPKLKALIEEILDTSVLDLLSNATLETGRTGIIAILSATPEVRPSAATLRLPKSS